MKYFYDHKFIEGRIQKLWDDNKINKFNPFSDKEGYYVLDMFPYPSGAGLHVGHPRGYTASDIISRMKRYQGYEVIHPIGWDAFGLPSEQYAIKTNKQPQNFTKLNINTFRNQLKKMGFSFDYDIEVNTSSEDYYKTTQWIFQEMYKMGLACLKESNVNWCPELKTVLSNEEIYKSKDDKILSLLGDFPVFQKKTLQWNLKITEYAEDFLNDFKLLDWPSQIIKAQNNWIGKTKGCLIPFIVNGEEYDIFTFNYSDLKNASCIMLSAEHEIIKKIKNNNIQKYIKNIKNLQAVYRKQKYNEGLFLNLYGHNKDLKIKLPIYVSVSLLEIDNNGTLINSPNIKDSENYDFCIKNNIKILENPKITNFKKYKATTFYKFHDWVFSRQRFWGEPFPIYYDENNKIFLDEELPVQLPSNVDFHKIINSNKTPLETITNWYFFDKNGKKYRRDKNVMPQWAGSSWYYIAYLLKATEVSLNKNLSLNDSDVKKVLKKYLPVDLYIGGQEHAVTHLLYARFWHKVLYKLGIVKCKEPFKKLYNQGMILGPDHHKMSKSRGNVINPDDIIELYGADALRCYEMFMAPLDSTFFWDDQALKSTRKWLDRVCRLFDKSMNDNITLEQKAFYYKTVKNISKNYDKLKFNIAISNMMVFIRYCFRNNFFNRECLKNFLIMFSCVCPFLADFLYQEKFANNKTSIFFESWPKYKKISIDEKVNIPIQFNGKKIGLLVVKRNMSKSQVIKESMKINKVNQKLTNSQIFNVIYIKNKIINFISK